jgi:hypothetical protein
VAYHHYLDGGATALPPEPFSQLHLVPKQLGNSSGTLTLLGLFFCHSHARLEEWRKVAPKAIIRTAGALEGGDDFAKQCANFNAWIWNASRAEPDFAFSKKWETYRKYEKKIKELKPDIDPMKIGKNRALKNAWVFFKALVYLGPAGPPPKPKPSIWEFRCNIVSNRSVKPAQRTVVRRQASSNRGPLGRA